jgi:uncharacterized membrane protein/protein-disulfide isomerase
MSLDAKPSFAGTRRLELRAAKVFLFVALSGASYLAFVSLSGEGVAGCGPGSGCNQVLSSRWAYWMGIPVSLPALAIYLGLLIATWTGDRTTPLVNKPAACFVIVALGGLIVLAAGWFGLLQYAIIKHWCKFCLATHASALVAVGLLIRNALVSQPASDPSQRRSFRLPNLAMGGAAAVFGLAVLITGQLAVKKPLYIVTAMSARAYASHSRTLTLYNGQFDLDPDALPLIGSPSATNYIVSLFDYTCKHCRRLHPLLRAVARSYSGRLAIISLPVPLDAHCNPLIQNTNPANANACDYARLGLAVWRARPASFPEFDDWLFDSDPLPSLDQARAKAEHLAGKEALAQALGSSWVRTQLNKNVDLYIANSRLTRNARLPQLIFGDAATGGSIENMDELMTLIRQHAPLNTGASPPITPGQPAPAR